MVPLCFGSAVLLRQKRSNFYLSIFLWTPYALSQARQNRPPQRRTRALSPVVGPLKRRCPLSWLHLLKHFAWHHLTPPRTLSPSIAYGYALLYAHLTILTTQVGSLTTRSSIPPTHRGSFRTPPEPARNPNLIELQFTRAQHRT